MSATELFLTIAAILFAGWLLFFWLDDLIEQNCPLVIHVLYRCGIIAGVLTLLMRAMK